MKLRFFYLWVLSYVNFCYCSRTWELCAEEARRLNKTVPGIRGLYSEGSEPEDDQPFVPRLDEIGLHPRYKRFLLPLMDEEDTGPGIAADEVRNRSLCPWEFEVDTNDTRIPSKLYKAVCHHNNGDNSCNFSFFRSSNTILALLREIECAVVYNAIEVAHECCFEGEYSLRKEWVDWPVACACARRKIRVVTATEN